MFNSRYAPTPLAPGPRGSALSIKAAVAPSRWRWIFILRFILLVVVSWSLDRLWRRKERLVRAAKKIRDDLEELGGLWVKAGQLIATRRDLVPGVLCDELARLQDQTAGFPFDSVRAIVEEELGSPLGEIFCEFEAEPLAAASVGQVHRARLRSNRREVVVKVRRPFIEEIFRSDFSVLERLSSFLIRLKILPNARWKDLLWELRRIMRTELDYRCEANAISRMKVTLQAHEVEVPEVYPEFSSLRVLTMGYICGVPLSDYVRVLAEDPERVGLWQLENQFDPEDAGRRLYHTHTRQVFEDNLFHCDLHPGNILLLREGRIALIDFGDVCSLQSSSQQSYFRIFTAVGKRDYRAVADEFLLLPRSLPWVDLEQVREEIMRALRDWEAASPIRELPYHQKSLTGAMQEIAKIFGRYAIPVSWEFLQLNRAQMTFDSSLIHLLPRIDYHAMIREYRREATVRVLERSLERDSLLTAAVQWIELLARRAEVLEGVRMSNEAMRNRALSLAQGPDPSLHVLTEILCRLASTLFLTGAVLLALGWIQQKYPELEIISKGVAWPQEFGGDGLTLVAIIACFYLHRMLLEMARRCATGRKITLLR